MSKPPKPTNPKAHPAEADYEVGYGRPPKHTRFKPGQSGNPNGRPKGHRNFKTDVVDMLKTPVTVRENGRARQVSTQEATLLRLRERALGGDQRALDRIIELAARYGHEEVAESAAGLSPSDREIVERALARRERSRRPHEHGTDDSAAQTVPTGRSEPEEEHTDG
jgi:hypothetical protein